MNNRSITGLGALFVTAGLLVVPIASAHADPAPNAHPTGGSVVAGSATITTNALDVVVTQTSNRAVIDWSTFNIGSQQSVQVAQPSAAAVTLMRATSSDPSRLAGKLTSNGTVVLISAHGTTIYKGGQLADAGLVISTAGISNANFMAGRMDFDRAGGGNAKVIDNGDVTVRQAGGAVLFGPAVSLGGNVVATRAHALIGAGKTMTLDDFGAGLASMTITAPDATIPQGTTALVSVTGTMRATGGRIAIAADAADGLLPKLISIAGKLYANSVSDTTGTIDVGATGGGAQLTGLLSATGGPKLTGGAVCAVASSELTLGSGGQVAVSGGGGGGKVGFGVVGSNLGKLKKACAGSPQSTPRVVIGTKGSIHANGTSIGNGGTIIVGASHALTQNGTLTAKGGPHAGNGGYIGLASGGSLTHHDTMNVSAPHGTFGTIHIS